MEYIGEHLLPGQLGRFFVSLALASAIVAAVAYYLSIKNKGKSSYSKLARASFITHALSIFGVVGTLFYLILSHYFEYDYVWAHSSTELPLKYIFSAFWEGQEGSFILWMFWHAVLGLILVFTAKKWEAPAMIVFSLVQAFLASMILGIYPFGLKIGSSPFVLMRDTADNIGLPWTQIPDYLSKFPAFMDGSGLNPLLQNYWMTIHPPTLFLGFASVLVPFAFAVSALFLKDYKGWIKPVLPWAYFSVMILGTGILMGGAWAYEALSFGGFWAWDPVENSSLVPWITMVSTAHLLLIARNRQTGLPSAFFMSILSFILILYSTFLTRSGVLGDSSVHSFVDLGLSGQLLIYLLFFTVIAYGVFFYRYKSIPKSEKDDELSSREFWMFIGSLILFIAAFQIIFSTSLPVLNQLIGPEGLIPIFNSQLAPPIDAIGHYNSFQVPFAVIIVLLMAIGQYLNYRQTSMKSFWKNILRALIVTVILTVIFAAVFDFWTQPIYLTLLFSGWFAAVSNLDYWLIHRKGKWSFSGSSIAHVGFALVVVGALISNAKKDIISSTPVFLSTELPSSENAVLELQDSVKMGDYIAVFNGLREEGNKQYYDVTYYPEADGSETFTLSPFLLMSDEMGATPNPSTKHFLSHDIYTHVQYSSYLEPATDDGYVSEMTSEFERGDTVIYQRHFIIMDSLKVNARLNEETGEMAQIKLTAEMRVVNIIGEEFRIAPSYILDGNILSHEDAYLETPPFKIRFSDINTESDMINITAWTMVDEDENPFIVLKAIVFPFINLLWAGSVLMALGSGIAVWQRLRS